MDDNSNEFQVVNQAALGYLARREHSRHELYGKLLSRKNCSEVVIDQVLDQLERDGYLSDKRFAEMFTRSRRERGKGPLRIKAELRQFGISEETFQEILPVHDDQWAQIARQVRERRFGVTLPESSSDRVKQLRFLQYRGFTPEQIRAAFNGSSING